MKKLVAILMACAVGLFIIAGCGAGDVCDDYVDLVCEKCGDSSDACKNAETMMDVAQESDDYECNEEDAETNTENLEAMDEDELKGFCESFM